MLAPFRLMGFLTMLPLTLVQAGAAGEKTPKVNPDADVEVVLRLSVETLDPLKSGDSHMECVVRNKSTRAIQVPSSYGGGFGADMSLRSTGRGGLRLVRWGQSKPKQKEETRALDPGKETMVFKESLKQ